MMKKLLACMFAMIVCLSAVSCGQMTDMYGAYPMKEADEAMYFAADNADGGFAYASKSVAESEGVSRAGGTNDAAAQSEKMVYYSTVSMETAEFEKASDSLHALIEKYGGIIAYENVYDLDSDYSRLNMTVRVPQENYNAFLDGLSADYHVVSVSNRVENMTEQYYDNENRLKSYRVQEERLLDLLGKADTVSDMLEIEARLGDVQYMIESYTNMQRQIDNDVRYATFTLNLSEVVKYTDPAPRTFFDRLGDALRGSAEGFRDFGEGSLFALIYLAPYLVLLGVIALVIVLSVRASRKKKKAAPVAETEKKSS